MIDRRGLIGNSTGWLLRHKAASDSPPTFVPSLTVLSKLTLSDLDCHLNVRR